jgi:hypothetical protein
MASHGVAQTPDQDTFVEKGVDGVVDLAVGEPLATKLDHDRGRADLTLAHEAKDAQASIAGMQPVVDLCSRHPNSFMHLGPIALGALLQLRRPETARERRA